MGLFKSDPRLRLPRHPNAERPRADEKVWRQGDADLQNGWLARHGKLSLTDTRLVFVPTPLDMLLRARRREIALDSVTRLERVPRDVDGGLVGGRRARFVIADGECDYQVMVGDLDNWLDMLEIVINRRRGSVTQPPRLSILRDGYVNAMLEAVTVDPTPDA